jgi:hypothetical protein
MPSNTYVLISSVTVGAGGSSSISFNSIPQTYTDLCLLTSISSNRGSVGENARVTFNGSTSGYATRRIYGTGSSAASDTDSGITTSINFGSVGDGFQANTFGNGILYIPNYAGSNNKSVSSDGVAEANQTTEYMALNASLWSNTSAITSITLTPQVGSLWIQYSTAYLYGIKNS